MINLTVTVPDFFWHFIFLHLVAGWFGDTSNYPMVKVHGPKIIDIPCI